jgi:hypothetical protein
MLSQHTRGLMDDELARRGEEKGGKQRLKVLVANK